MRERYTVKVTGVGGGEGETEKVTEVGGVEGKMDSEGDREWVGVREEQLIQNRQVNIHTPPSIPSLV